MSSPDLLASLERLQDAIRANGADEVPEGWHTAESLGEAWGLSVRRARELLREGVKLGTWEKERFRVMRDGRARPMDHYREV